MCKMQITSMCITVNICTKLTCAKLVALSAAHLIEQAFYMIVHRE